jgi:putative transposase
VDNGAAYRSRHLEHITASLGIALAHAKPYQPQGKCYVAYCTSFVV